MSEVTDFDNAVEFLHSVHKEVYGVKARWFMSADVTHAEVDAEIDRICAIRDEMAEDAAWQRLLDAESRRMRRMYVDGVVPALRSA